MLNKDCFMYTPENTDICDCLKNKSAKKYHKKEELSNCPFAKSLEEQLAIEEKCKKRILGHGMRFKSRATGEVTRA